MPAKFLRQRELVEVPSFSHNWDYKDMPGAGYYAPCDKDGNIIGRTDITNRTQDEDREFSQKIYDQLMTGIDSDGREMIYRGIEDHSYSYTQNAAIGCENCKAPVFLDYSSYNTCKCGAEYNSFGQRLAPRKQWGEETGETWLDVPNYPIIRSK